LRGVSFVPRPDMSHEDAIAVVDDFLVVALEGPVSRCVVIDTCGFDNSASRVTH